MPPDLVLLSTLIGSNYPCLELIFMVPKVFEPLKFDCITTLREIETLFQWKIHGVMFKVLYRDNGPSSFQEMVTNSTKYCLK